MLGVVQGIVARWGLASNAWGPLWVIAVVFIHGIGLIVHDTVHRVVATIAIVVAAKAAHACPSACAPTGTFIVASQGVSSSEFTTTFGADVWSFACVQLGVAFEVVQTAEARLTRRAYIWFFLAVGQQMALQVMVSREFGGAIRTLVLLRGRGSGTLAGAGMRQAHTTTSITMWLQEWWRE
jgi:hypothetical protein